MYECMYKFQHRLLGAFVLWYYCIYWLLYCSLYYYYYYCYCYYYYITIIAVCYHV